VRIDAQLTTFEEVTAASRTTEAVEDAPASVTIVTRQELRAMGYPTIAEAVRGVRGIYLSDDRSYVTIGVRGFSRPGDYGNRVLVLVDGQPANDNYIWSSYVGFDGRTDIEDIDRIEIVRGAGSVLYGTGAFFGVINLVTRDRNNPTFTEVGLSTAEYGVGRARGTQMVRINEDAGFWASVAGAVGSGRDFYFPELVADPNDPDAELGANGLPIDGNVRERDDFKSAMFNGRVWYKSLTLQWFYNGRSKTLPTGEYDTIVGDSRTKFIDHRAFVEARFEPQVTKELQLLSRAHGNIYTFDGDLPFPVADGGVSHDEYRGLWGGFEQRLVISPTERMRFTLGAEVIRHFKTEQSGEDDNGPYLFDTDGSGGRNDPFTVFAAYALGDVGFTEWLKVSAGARIDYFSSLEFEADAAISPRVAMIIKPYSKGNLKLLGGKAFRAPSVYELYYTGVGQVPPDNIQPEQIYSGEVEFTHRFTDTVSATIAGFGNYVLDLIELRQNAAGLDQYGNSTSPVAVFGGEVEVRRDWKEGWMVGASYTLQQARYLDAPTLRDVPNSPQHLGSIKGAVPIIGRALMGMTRLSVEGPRKDTNDVEGPVAQGNTDAAVVWDIVLSGEAERLGIRYNFGVYNAMDWRYDTVPSTEFRQRTIVQNGRTFLAAASARF
jgi:outer membrane receptor protein involved in Fe transport